MFICLSCGEVFEEAKVIEEHHPYGMTYATEYWNVCPRCEDSDYQEAMMCDLCGNYVETLREGLCDRCYNDEGVKL